MSCITMKRNVNSCSVSLTYHVNFFIVWRYLFIIVNHHKTFCYTISKLNIKECHYLLPSLQYRMCCSVLSPQMKNHLYSWLFHSRTINYLNFSAKLKEKISSSNHNARVIMFGGGGGIYYTCWCDIHVHCTCIIDHDIKIFVHHGRVHVWCPRIWFQSAPDNITFPNVF